MVNTTLLAENRYSNLLPAKRNFSVGGAYHNGAESTYKYCGDSADVNDKGQVTTVDIGDDKPERSYSGGNGYHLRVDWGAERYLHVFDHNIPLYGFGIFGEYRSIKSGFVPYSGWGGGMMVSASLVSMRIGYGSLIYMDDSNLEKFSHYTISNGVREEVYEPMGGSDFYVLFGMEVDIPLWDHLHPYIGIDAVSFKTDRDEDALYTMTSYLGARYIF